MLWWPKIVSISADPARHLLVLDKGSNQGVFKGQSLLGAEGLMGQIVLVGANSSRAMLITDAAHAVPVQVNRSGVRALTEGVGNINELIVRHVARTTDIKVDDVLVTSGLAGRFPPGYPVARGRGRLRRILARLSPRSLRARSRNSIAAVTFCSPRLRWPALLACREHEHRQLWVIWTSLIVGLIAYVVPLPLSWRWFRPEVPLLVLFYWNLALPHRVGLFSAAIMGLTLDIINGSAVGALAFGTVIATLFILVNYQRIRQFDSLLQSAVIGIVNWLGAGH